MGSGSPISCGAEAKAALISLTSRPVGHIMTALGSYGTADLDSPEGLLVGAGKSCGVVMGGSSQGQIKVGSTPYLEFSALYTSFLVPFATKKLSKPPVSQALHALGGKGGMSHNKHYVN